jgi:putative endonuclease
MFYLYIIYSATKNKYYVGQTDNIQTRVEHHNSGISPYTSITNDWMLVYSELFKLEINPEERRMSGEK